MKNKICIFSSSAKDSNFRLWETEPVQLNYQRFSLNPRQQKERNEGKTRKMLWYFFFICHIKTSSLEKPSSNLWVSTSWRPSTKAVLTSSDRHTHAHTNPDTLPYSPSSVHLVSEVSAITRRRFPSNYNLLCKTRESGLCWRLLVDRRYCADASNRLKWQLLFNDISWG